LWRRAYCREAVTRRAEEEPRRRTSVSFFLWRTTEQAGVPLGGFARKNGRWVGLKLFAFRWADSISQFEPSYIQKKLYPGGGNGPTVFSLRGSHTGLPG